MLAAIMQAVTSYATILVVLLVPAFLVFSVLPFVSRVVRNR